MYILSSQSDIIYKLGRQILNRSNAKGSLLRFSAFVSTNTTGEPLNEVNPTIKVSELGVSGLVLPGGKIERVHEKTGEKTLVDVDQAFGYFWQIGDLRKNGGKPVVANDALIPESEAQLFPRLDGLMSLSGENNISLPNLLRRETSIKSKASGCTLCAISFKEFGFKQLQSWVQPFTEALCHGIGPRSRVGRVKVVQISITEGGGIVSMMKGLMMRSMKSSTPEDLHDSSLVYFGSREDTIEFKQNLRMHNTLVGYAVLVDDLGRVRWMSSGGANEHELTTLIDSAIALTPTPSVRSRSNIKR